MNNKFFEEPIINSSYEYPRRHWELVDGQPTQKITASRALLVARKKALDVISTYRFIGANGDSNPIAQWLFEKTGLAGVPAKRVVRVLSQRNASHEGLLLWAASSLHHHLRHVRHF